MTETVIPELSASELADHVSAYHPLYEYVMSATSSMDPALMAERVQEERSGQRVSRLAFLFVGGIERETAVVRPSPLVRTRLDPRVMIRNLRTVAGLTTIDLAGVMRVSRQSIHNWINGDTVTVENRQRLAIIHRQILEMVAGRTSEEAREYLLRDDVDGGKSRLAVLGCRADVDVEDSRGFTAYDLLAGSTDDSPVDLEVTRKRTKLGAVKSRSPKDESLA